MKLKRKIKSEKQAVKGGETPNAEIGGNSPLMDDLASAKPTTETPATEVIAAPEGGAGMNVAPEISAEEKFHYCPTTVNWSCQYEAVAGVRHRDAQPPLPCQDSAESSIIPTPFVIIADGAGSSSMSDYGAQAVVMGLSRLLKTLQTETAHLLDAPEETLDAGRRFALTLVKHAKGILTDLSQMHRRPVKDFRCTLLLAVIGKENLLWLKVGDGALVQEKMRLLADGKIESEWRTLGESGKGDFANETTFVDDHLQPEDVQVGLVPAADICGLAAMSDGAALALVSNDGKQIARRLSTWTQDLRNDKLKKSTLTAGFYDADFSRRTMGDDCSLALVSCALDIPRIAST
jgi:hypothetical protein